jgi:hypothetical protein
VNVSTGLCYRYHPNHLAPGWREVLVVLLMLLLFVVEWALVRRLEGHWRTWAQHRVVREDLANRRRFLDELHVLQPCGPLCARPLYEERCQRKRWITWRRMGLFAVSGHASTDMAMCVIPEGSSSFPEVPDLSACEGTSGSSDQHDSHVSLVSNAPTVPRRVQIHLYRTCNRSYRLEHVH